MQSVKAGISEFDSEDSLYFLISEIAFQLGGLKGCEIQPSKSETINFITGER